MAEKFGNFRWVKGGYLDDSIEGYVVGKIEFAAIGEVEFCLKGDFKPDIAGKIIRLKNAKFLDDPNAGNRLEGFSNPHFGQVSMISFDPHPLLTPHPYIEWFSEKEDHFRIELEPDEGWVVEGDEARQLHQAGLQIFQNWASTMHHQESNPSVSEDQEWF